LCNIKNLVLYQKNFSVDMKHTAKKLKPIVVFDCVDKKFITHDRNPLLPSGGERLILAGRSNSGKGSAAKNIIGRLNPVVIHSHTLCLEKRDDNSALVVAELVLDQNP
jgi:polyphosphate kinase 2 (PPK2 family)